MKKALPMSTPFDQWPDPAQFPGAPLPALTDADAPVGDDAPPPPDGGQDDRAEETAAFTVWVGQQLARLEAFGVERKGEVPWCPTWWQHPEVVERLYVSWLAHGKAEQLARDGDGQALSQWWIHHWDHHAGRIFDRARGPLRFCSPQGHHSESVPKQQPFITLSALPSDWTI
jgi:hypothetical protein